MIKNNVIITKSMDFAIRVVKLYQYLRRDKKEYVMSDQILRSGTRIGANLREGIYAQSKDDFISKMSIALKEASETEYWLELLFKTEYLNQEQYTSMMCDCGELAKILIATLKSTKSEK